MILFALNLAIMLLTLYLFLKEAKKRPLLFLPVAGIIFIFTFHCLYFRSSCISCSLASKLCQVELLLFWLFIALGAFLRAIP